MAPMRKALRVFVHPVLWLLVASAATALFMWQRGSFDPVRRPDTNSYENLSIPKHEAHDADLEGREVLLALSSTRTLAYPFFLDLVRPLTPRYTLVPWIHWSLFTLAMVYFWYAVSTFSGSRWFGFSVAVPLAFPCGLSYFAWVLPEALAAVFAVSAVASVVLIAKHPRSRLAWIGLTAATFLAYQSKPVMQFLVVLLPVLALVLRLSVEPQSLRSLRRWLVQVVAATALPLLLFCTVRLVVVGQFSLVSFNGYNLIGIAANLIDEDVVAALPEEHQSMAERILRAREAKGRKPFSARPSMRTWRKNYVSDQWKISESVARHVVLEEMADGRLPGAELVPINIIIERRLAELSSHVLRLHPRLYLKWVTGAFRYGVYRFLECPPIRWLLAALMISAPLAFTIGVLRRRRDTSLSPQSGGSGEAYGVPLGGVVLVATAFYLCCTALISLVSWPLPRYLALTTLLLPSALGGALFVLWATALRGRKSLRPPASPNSGVG